MVYGQKVNNMLFYPLIRLSGDSSYQADLSHFVSYLNLLKIILNFWFRLNVGNFRNALKCLCSAKMKEAFRQLFFFFRKAI
jgi:hypothetical protein